MNFENITKSLLTIACSKVRQATWVYPVIGITLATLVTPSQAAIIVSPGESITFQDSFADNSNGWTDVAVVNGTGTAAINQAEISGSNWQPSLPNPADPTDTTIASSSTLPTALDITEGPISLYMSVRVDDVNTSDASVFSMQLNESTGNKFFYMSIRPNATGFLQYRNDVDVVSSKELGSTSSIITSNATFYDFKLTLTANGAISNPASAEAFYYDTVSSSYLSLGSADDLFELETGLFNTLSITNRNGINGAAYFDELVVTQVPESSTLTLFGILAFATLLLFRKKK